MIVGLGTHSYTISLELEGSGGTRRISSIEVIGGDALLEIILWEVRVGYFKDFIATLFVDIKDRPVSINNEGIWRFITKIDSRTKASWLEGDVVVEGSWKSFISKIKYLCISDVDGGVNIICFKLWIF